MSLRLASMLALGMAAAPLALATCDHGAAPAGSPAIEIDDLLEVYEYDPDAPLPFSFAEESASDGRRAVRFTFRTWEREPVNGLVALPASGSPPFPTVVYFHRLVEDESAALAVADALGELGVAVMCARLPIKRVEAGGGAPASERRMESFRNRRMAVLEARSALDAIVARGIADPRRVAAVGASAGGGPAVVFAAVEPRVRAAAALSVGAFEFPREIPKRAASIAYESRLTVASVDPLEFAPLVSPRPLLVVRGADDSEVSEASARALLDAAREPKRFETVPGEGHRIGLAAVGKTLVEFLRAPLSARQ